MSHHFGAQTAHLFTDRKRNQRGSHGLQVVLFEFRQEPQQRHHAHAVIKGPGANQRIRRAAKDNGTHGLARGHPGRAGADARRRQFRRRQTGQYAHIAPLNGGAAGRRVRGAHGQHANNRVAITQHFHRTFAQLPRIEAAGTHDAQRTVLFNTGHHKANLVHVRRQTEQRCVGVLPGKPHQHIARAIGFMRIAQCFQPGAHLSGHAAFVARRRRNAQQIGENGQARVFGQQGMSGR